MRLDLEKMSRLADFMNKKFIKPTKLAFLS